MKKTREILAAAVVSLLIVGCGTSSSSSADVREGAVQLQKYYLVDADGYALADVPYYCSDDDGYETEVFVTDNDGSFLYYPSEQCTFDLEGLYGWRDDPIFIEKSDEVGVENIPYQCASGAEGFSDEDGFFYYVEDDICTLYL